MKKTISSALAVFMILPLILSVLSGCNTTASADNSIINGELISLVNEAFDFSGYTSSEPYYANIAPGSAYFEAVQTAVEYDVIDGLAKEIDPLAPVTREFFAMVISGAIYDDRTADVTIADISKITFKDDVLTVLNYGLMSLDDKGCFNPAEKMGSAECAALIDEALNIRSACTVDSPEYDIKLKEGVIDTAGLNCYYIDQSTGKMAFDEAAYSETKALLTANHFSYSRTAGEITVDSADALGLKLGSVMVVPSDGASASEAVRITGVTQNPDGTYTLKTTKVSGEEIIEDFRYEYSAVPDFSKAVFKDADGNVVSGAPIPAEEQTILLSGAAGGDAVFDDAVARTGGKSDGAYKTLASGGGFSHDFDTPLGKVSLAAGDGYIRASVSTVLGKNDNGSCTLSYGYGFENIRFDTACDIPFIGKKHVKLVMNYTTAEKLGVKGNYAKTVTVGSVSVPIDPAGVFEADVKVSLGVTFEGELNITLSTSGRATGFEWRGGTNFSVVNNAGTKTFDVSGKAKLEATVPVTVSISALWGALEAGVTITPGAGAKMNIETTQIPNNGGDPTPLICTTVDAYPILRTRIYVTLNLFGSHTKDANAEIFGEKDVAFTAHLEMFGAELPQVVPECTKDRRLNQLKDDETKAAGVLVGDELKISVYKAELGIDETLAVNVTMVPSGYNYEDIAVCCMNTDIVSLENAFKVGIIKKSGGGMKSFSQNITGLNEGKTQITFTTVDLKYKASCSVTVIDKNKPLDYSIKLSTYGTNVQLGTTGTIKIESMPYTITEDDVLWESDNTDVVIVDQYGRVSAVGEGYAIVTAATPDRRSTAACAITVNGSGNVSVTFAPHSTAGFAEYKI